MRPTKSPGVLFRTGTHFRLKFAKAPPAATLYGHHGNMAELLCTDTKVHRTYYPAEPCQSTLNYMLPTGYGQDDSILTRIEPCYTSLLVYR